MIQKALFKILMAPFALLYGTGVALRNGLYRVGLLKEISFNIPVISIGNLTMGGAGKTPHVEYLANWLQDYIKIAVLSRGYKRKTKGFRIVDVNDTAATVGDEPLQYKRKFPEVNVYVSESRVLGIPKILSQQPDMQVILLDDAFQHRSVKPGLNILLTTYHDLFVDDFLLPMGRLREWRQAYKRADLIIVTKCPNNLSTEDRKRVEEKINPLPDQALLYSTYQYTRLYHLLYPSVTMNLRSDMQALVISAIANTDFLLAFLEQQLGEVKIIEYEDHHAFTRYEMGHLKNEFEKLGGKEKIIITTEKDATRLEPHIEFLRKEEMPVFVLPVYVSFDADDDLRFKQIVQSYLLSFKI
ncbi:MAG: tetraacyldisaccharide 4'-kinase [Saprospiraceae bacterium]|nr:tetraacyldisaccharide 4'-kinase [Saprospiraceae bacterium]